LGIITGIGFVVGIIGVVVAFIPGGQIIGTGIFAVGFSVSVLALVVGGLGGAT
jgi:hypothetical protein